MMKLIQRTLLLFTLCYSSFTSASNLVIEITSGVDDPVPIAIAPFGWTGDQTLSEDIGNIIGADLKRSGQFEPIPRSAMLSFPTEEKNVHYRDWKYINVEYLVIGNLESVEKGFRVNYHLFDIQQQKILKSSSFIGARSNLRALAHRISDVVYEALTGVRGAFSTKVIYVSADKRVNPSSYRLIKADADGYNAESILVSKDPIMSPSWSRDGKKVAYVSFENRGRPSIFVQDIISTRRHKIKSFKGINGSPAWSPDGKKLALVLSKDGNPEIYILDLTNGKIKRVTNHYAIDTEPSWTPDGKNIIFTSDRGGKPQIYMLELATNWVERVTFEGDYNARGRLTQDGRFLVLVSRQNKQFYIAVQDMQRGTMTRLTQSDLDESPSIAPNGSMVLYSTVSGGKDILAAVSIDGLVKYKMPATKGVVREAAWSPYLD